MRYVLAVMALLLSVGSAMAEDKATALTKSQKAAVEEIIENYLTKEHPEILMKAMQELQRRDQATAEAKSAAAIKTNKVKIYEDANTPVGGNPKGDVTIVEFSDFQCGYCKMSEPFVEKLLKEDGNIRFIYKDFPVLGPASTSAAKMALAVARQGTDKYIKYHDALLAKQEHLNDDIILQTVKDIGADAEQAKKDAASDAIAKQVQTNLDLGVDIGVRGTPMFIIGDKTFPGALQYEQLKKAVEEARNGKKG